MEITVTLGENAYHVDTRKPLNLAIPLRFDGTGPRIFGAPTAQAAPYQAGDFIGDVRQGSSCNCETYNFAPHLHGTHTECAGHITAERIAVHDTLQDSFLPASLVTVTPENDLITAAMLNNIDQAFTAALIVRTLPNDDSKMSCNYDENPAPSFAADAMEKIDALGVMHLLTDIPSIDRADSKDLPNHHQFFDRPGRTITEMIYAPDSVTDGPYLLNLQIAPFMADAAPSRPVLYEVQKQ